MSELARADFFFLITTVAVIVITVLILIFLLYSIRVVRNVRHISERAREEADAILSDVDSVRLGIKAGGKKA